MKAKKQDTPEVSAQERRQDRLRRDAQEARRALRGVQQRTRHSHVFITPQALAAAAEIKQAELDAAWAEHQLMTAE
jgi:hypothetical protein